VVGIAHTHFHVIVVKTLTLMVCKAVVINFVYTSLFNVGTWYYP
jgi:hypothetical protein